MHFTIDFANNCHLPEICFNVNQIFTINSDRNVAQGLYIKALELYVRI
jgi:hypothetical protein